MDSNLPADLQDLQDELYSTTHGKITEIIIQTLLYGHPCHFSHVVHADYSPSGIYLGLVPITVHAMV